MKKLSLQKETCLTQKIGRPVSGFTLVELIVVITILAILGTIAILAFSGYSKNARDSARLSDLSNIKKTLELWILQSGTYPEPSDASNIEYSGGLVWTQGTFGDSVYNTVGKLDKKPKDPLYDVDYTYSLTQSKKEYQIGAVLEGTTAYTPIAQTYAATESKAYILGTYNGILATTDTIPMYILALPSIILSDIGDADLKATTVSLSYEGKDNLPSSYNDTSLTMTGGTFTFNPIEVWSGTTLTDLNDQTEFQLLVANLQEAYKSDDSFSNLPEYTNITSADFSIMAMSSVKALIEINTGEELTAVATTPVFNDCDFNGTIVLNGNNVTAYLTTTVPYGQTCTSELRTCNNAVLSGTYTNATCSVDGAVGTFTLSSTGVTQGTNVTITNNCSVAPTSYTSSNAGVATVSGTTITTLTAGTTNIEPVGGACADSTAKTLTVNAPPSPFVSCTAAGQIKYVISGVAGTSATGLTCSDDIIICSGNSTGYKIAACNAGASTVYTNQTFPAGHAGARNTTVNTWAGGLYQWGNNADLSLATTTTSQISSCGSYANSNFSYGVLVINWTDWCTTQRDVLWGGTSGTNTDRKGPCSTGYHVPTNAEWIAVHTAGGWGGTLGTNMMNSLKLPLAGRREGANGSMSAQGNEGEYWASSPNSGAGNSYSAYFTPSYIYINNTRTRAQGLAVRCFKN